MLIAPRLEVPCQVFQLRVFLFEARQLFLVMLWCVSLACANDKPSQAPHVTDTCPKLRPWKIDFIFTTSQAEFASPAEGPSQIVINVHDAHVIQT